MALATLTTLTPVHIGSGQTLKKGFDFIQEGNRIGFLDLDKVIRLIGSDSIPQLSAAIEKGEPLSDFLRKGRGFKNFGLEDIVHRIADAKNIATHVTELKEQYFTSIKGVCIPGSSLKGAIKTAIWETLTNEEFLKTLERKDFGFENRRKNKWEWNDQAIEKKLFGKNANEKSTRFLRIGDCHFENVQTQVFEVGIYNAYRSNWDFKNGNNILAEVIPAGASSLFEIKFDDLLLKTNKTKYPEDWVDTHTHFISGSTSDFCGMINSYTKNLLNWEFEDLQTNGFDKHVEGETMLNELERVYKFVSDAENSLNNQAFIRIGGSNGWKFTTGGWTTKPDVPLSDDEFGDLRKTIQRRDYSDMGFWPKTRKMTVTGIPFGFVKISFSKNNVEKSTSS
jgi:CRISPR-associated protein Csm5